MLLADPPQLELDLFADASRWPKKPYCSDDLASGVKIRSFKQAITKPYIQCNLPWLRNWLVFDLDYEGAAIATEAAGLPWASWAAVNRENGHAHIAYGLQAPVLVDDLHARSAPIRYMVAIERMIAELLRADMGFAGLITKNPAHPLWRVLRGPQMLFLLQELAEYLPGLEKFRPRQGKRAEQIGVGRNVSLFDTLRKWAYRAVREYWGGGLQGWNAWLSSCNTRALVYNGDFPAPMDGREVWHIAKSVAKYVWKHFTPERYSRWRTAQGRRGGLKGGAARSALYEDQRASARLMHATGMSARAIARELGCSPQSVLNWVSK